MIWLAILSFVGGWILQYPAETWRMVQSFFEVVSPPSIMPLLGGAIGSALAARRECELQSATTQYEPGLRQLWDQYSASTATRSGAE